MFRRADGSLVRRRGDPTRWMAKFCEEQGEMESWGNGLREPKLRFEGAFSSRPAGRLGGVDAEIQLAGSRSCAQVKVRPRARPGKSVARFHLCEQSAFAAAFSQWARRHAQFVNYAAETRFFDDKRIGKVKISSTLHFISLFRNNNNPLQE